MKKVVLMISKIYPLSPVGNSIRRVIENIGAELVFVGEPFLGDPGGIKGKFNLILVDEEVFSLHLTGTGNTRKRFSETSLVLLSKFHKANRKGSPPAVWLMDFLGGTTKKLEKFFVNRM